MNRSPKIPSSILGGDTNPFAVISGRPLDICQITHLELPDVATLENKEARKADLTCQYSLLLKSSETTEGLYKNTDCKMHTVTVWRFI